MVVYMAARYGGVVVVAATVAGFYLVASPLYYMVIATTMGGTVSDVLRIYAFPAVASGLAAGVAFWCTSTLHLSALMSIPTTMLVFVPSYVTLISYIAPDAWREAVGLITAQGRKVQLTELTQQTISWLAARLKKMRP
jgi:hypothetical protein